MKVQVKMSREELWDVVVCLKLSVRCFPDAQQERVENLYNRLNELNKRLGGEQC